MASPGHMTTSERPVGKLEDPSDDFPPVPHAESKEAKEGRLRHLLQRSPEPLPLLTTNGFR